MSETKRSEGFVCAAASCILTAMVLCGMLAYVMRAEEKADRWRSAYTVRLARIERDLAAPAEVEESAPTSVSVHSACVEYAKGVNDALDTISLLSLELKLEGERKNWGEMSEIVCNRLRVERAPLRKKEE